MKTDSLTIKYKIFSLLGFFVLLIIYLSNKKSNEQTPKFEALNIAWETFPRTYDPRYATDANSQYLEGLIHCSLITFSPEGELQGDLAKSWLWKDSKTLKMAVKDSYFFSSGKRVRPKDIKATYDSLLFEDLKTPSPRKFAFNNIEKIEATNEHITFYLKEEDATFMSNLVLGILPQNEITQKILMRDSKTSTCGYYKLEEVTLNDIQLKANQYHPSYLKNKNKNISIKIVKDETTRFLKLRNGELDIVQNGINTEKIKNIDSYKDLALDHVPSLKSSYIGFNFKHSILKEKSVRKAIAHAIDRKEIQKYILNEMASLSSTILPKDHPYYNNNIDAILYDPKISNTLLDESGFLKNSRGVRFKLNLLITQDQTRISIAKAIKGQLVKVGIDLNIKVLEWGKFKEEVEKGHVDLWMLAWVGFKDPDIYRYVFSTESFVPQGGNRGKYSNFELDELLDLGKKNHDFLSRKNIYDKVQKIIFDDMPYVFLFHEHNIVVRRSNIQNFTLYSDGRYSSLVHTLKK